MLPITNESYLKSNTEVRYYLPSTHLPVQITSPIHPGLGLEAVVFNLSKQDSDFLFYIEQI